VYLVQVQVVGLEPAQGPLDGTPDVGPAALGPGRGAVPHVEVLVAELRREDDLVAPPGEYLAKQFLRASPVAVRVGRVQQRHTGLERRVHHFPGRVQAEPAAEVVAAKAGDRNDQPGVAQ